MCISKREVDDGASVGTGCCVILLALAIVFGSLTLVFFGSTVSDSTNDNYEYTHSKLLMLTAFGCLCFLFMFVSVCLSITVRYAIRAFCFPNLKSNDQDNYVFNNLHRMSMTVGFFLFLITVSLFFASYPGSSISTRAAINYWVTIASFGAFIFVAFVIYVNIRSNKKKWQELRAAMKASGANFDSSLVMVVTPPGNKGEVTNEVDK